MAKATEISDDVLRMARAVKGLRERYNVTQRQVADAHVDEISFQYVGMNEQGKVPGIVKPATQRKLLDAISKAANLSSPLTLDDLAAAADGGLADGGPGRALRAAASLRSAMPERQAVFPTSEGDVVFSYPADMTQEGFRELEAYFAVFVSVNAPKN